MIFYVLTAVLIVLKALEIITWSWWLVLAPALVVFVWSMIVLVGVCILWLKN